MNPKSNFWRDAGTNNRLYIESMPAMQKLWKAWKPDEIFPKPESQTTNVKT